MDDCERPAVSLERTAGRFHVAPIFPDQSIHCILTHLDDLTPSLARGSYYVMELNLISEGLDPSTGSPITPGDELPDGQTLQPTTTDLPVMTIGGNPFGENA